MSRWQTILAIDSDRWACETYRANFPGVRVECAPVANIVGALPPADVILGGPPCQPFSDAGENEGESDERDCIPDFCAAVADVMPRMFLMENVRGLLKERHLPYFGRVLEKLESSCHVGVSYAGGYVVQYRVLDAVSFGVPQFRERVWVWGIRRDLYAAGVRHRWPLPTHAWPPPNECMFGAALLPGVTVGQALGLERCVIVPPRQNGCPEQFSIDEPSRTIGATRADEWRVRAVGSGSNPHFIGDKRTERDITDEPSPTIPCGDRFGNVLPSLVVRRERGTGLLERHGPRPDFSIDEPSQTISAGSAGSGCRLSFVSENPVLWRWSDALLDKQPPIELDKPAPTVIKNWHKGTPYGCVKWKQDRDGLWIRRLHPLECARLQSVPDDFAWPSAMPKTHAYKVIGNGWATRMGAVFSEAFALADPRSRTVIDLFCGGGLGACGWHGRLWRYEMDCGSCGAELHPQNELEMTRGICRHCIGAEIGVAPPLTPAGRGRAGA